MNADRRPPMAVHVIAAVGLGLVVVPIVALAVRAPWTSIGGLLGDGAVRSVLVRSMVTSLLAALIVVVLGLPLAWVLARSPFPGRSLARAVVAVPMVLPPVVGGVALLLAFGRRGLAGPLLESVGVTVPFTTAAVVLAQAFVALPFFVLTVEGALVSLDPVHDDAAASLGARPWFAFRRVTLPLVRPSIVAGVALAWVRALGEFGATITFAGGLAGRTAPVEVFLALERGDVDAANALSLVLLAVAVVVLVALRRRWLPT